MTGSSRTYRRYDSDQTCIPLVRHAGEGSDNTAQIVRKHMKDLIIRSFIDKPDQSVSITSGSGLPAVEGERGNSARALRGNVL